MYIYIWNVKSEWHSRYKYIYTYCIYIIYILSTFVISKWLCEMWHHILYICLISVFAPSRGDLPLFQFQPWRVRSAAQTAGPANKLERQAWGKLSRVDVCACCFFFFNWERPTSKNWGAKKNRSLHLFWKKYVGVGIHFFFALGLYIRKKWRWLTKGNPPNSWMDSFVDKITRGQPPKLVPNRGLRVCFVAGFAPGKASL